MKNFGFTLAEVLITVGILAVVAVMTVPAVTTNIRETQLSAALKLNAATISDKLDAAMALEQVSDIRDLKPFRSEDIKGFLEELYGYLSIAKVGEDHDVYALSGGSDSLMTWSSDNYVQLQTGAFLYVADMDETIKENATSTIRAAGGNLLRRNATIYLDVNGFKKPDRLGHDVFKFYLGQDGRLYPVGGKDVSLFESSGASATTHSWNGENEDFTCDKTVNGYGCAGRVEDERRIKYL